MGKTEGACVTRWKAKDTWPHFSVPVSPCRKEGCCSRYSVCREDKKVDQHLSVKGFEGK